MSCTSPCLNQGICVANETCQCMPCFMGTSCEINVNVLQFSLTFAMHWDIRQADQESDFNRPRFLYTLAVAFLLAMALGNTIVSFFTFLLPDIRLTNCGIFQMLYCWTGFFAIIGMQLRMLTMLTFDALIFTYAYRYVACNILPVLVILMGDACMWLSALLAIEFVLLECFELNVNRTRWFSVISSSIAFVLIIGSHLHEIIARRPLIDPLEPESYTCTFAYPLPLEMIDKVLRVCHVVLPCFIHFVSSFAIILNITRRIAFVRDRKDVLHIFFREFRKRKHFLIPPFCFIFFNLPHLVIHLIDQCEDARDIPILRRHVAFNLLVYVPAASTFFIYIFPSKSYMQQFRSTWIARCFRRCSKKKKSPWFVQVPMSPSEKVRLHPQRPK